MPLYEAKFSNSTNKIYGVCDNYVHKFNSTTGALEASQKVAAPCYGPMRICINDVTIYVSSWRSYLRNAFDSTAPLLKQIWHVDKDTLAVSNPWDLGQKLFDYSYSGDSPDFGHTAGFHDMIVDGTRLFFQSTWLTNSNVGWISLDGLTHTIEGPSHGNILPQQIATDDSGKLLECDPIQYEVERWQVPYPPTINDGEATDPAFTERPMAVCWVTGWVKGYVVCGNIGSLWRVDDWEAGGGGVITKFNLEAVQANVKATRLREVLLGGWLAIPCPNRDGIILWDPSSDDPDVAVWIGGLNSPIDVVECFGGSGKVFAVQSSPVGLVDITSSIPS